MINDDKFYSDHHYEDGDGDILNFLSLISRYVFCDPNKSANKQMFMIKIMIIVYFHIYACNKIVVFY